MALTGDQLKPILQAKLRDALQARKPESNVTGWRSKLADDIGVRESTFENWFYGPQPNAPATLPSMENWVALCLLLPGLQDAVLGDITGERNGGGERREIAERIRTVGNTLADDIERGDTQPVSVLGKNG